MGESQRENQTLYSPNFQPKNISDGMENEKTLLEIIIDRSGSMGTEVGKKYLMPDGNTRMSIVRKWLSEDILPGLEIQEPVSVRIRLFAGVGGEKKNENGKPHIWTLFDKNRFDLKELQDVVSKIPDPPSGGSPIGFAVEETISYFSDYPDAIKILLLLTDGEENMEGDHLEALQKAKDEGINYEVYYIKIDYDKKRDSLVKNVINEKLVGTFIPIRIPSKPDNYQPEKNRQRMKKLGKRISIQNKHQKSSNFGTANQQNVKKKSGLKRPMTPDPKTHRNKEEKSSPSAEIEQFKVLMEELRTENNDLKAELSKLKQEIEDLKLAENTSKQEVRGVEEVQIDEDSDLNELIGSTSEKLVFNLLTKQYPGRVKWMNEHGESYLPFDFLIKGRFGGIKYYVECKGTTGSTKQILLTDSEWELMGKNKRKYRLCIVTNALETSLTKIHPLIPLWDYLSKGKAVPYSNKSEIVKAKRIRILVGQEP